MTDPRCIHGRYRIDPCIGCGRTYVDGALVGTFQLGIPDVVHLSPRLGHGLTPCCRRRHDELPAGERITLYPSLVTCPGRDWGGPVR